MVIADKDDSVVYDGYQVISLARMLVLQADATEHMSSAERKGINLDESPANGVESSTLNQVLVILSTLFFYCLTFSTTPSLYQSTSFFSSIILNMGITLNLG